MTYVVEVERRFRAVQGLPSPIRTQRGLSLLTPGEGVAVVLTAGVAFDDDQLTDRGWFLDTDAVARILDETAGELSARPWTELFDFRPTFELVTRHLYGHLSARIPQLSFVELRDDTFGVTTRWSPV